MIICLRPQPDCDADVSVLTAEDIKAVALPMLDILYPPDPPDLLSRPDLASQYQGLIITSKQAGRYLAATAQDLPGLSALPVWCVGAASAGILRSARFEIADHGSSGAVELASRISCEVLGSKPVFLWLSGRDIHLDVGACLSDSGVSVDRVIVYQAEPLNRPRPDISDRLAAGGRVGVVVFSARTFSQFEIWRADHTAPAHKAQMTILAASPALAEQARAAGFETRTAATPEREAVLGLCRDWSAQNIS